MADAALDDDPLIEHLSALPDPGADARRAERTRARCHQILARRRRQPRAWLAPVRTWMPVVEAAFVSALALLYLEGAIQRALVLWGH